MSARRTETVSMIVRGVVTCILWSLLVPGGAFARGVERATEASPASPSEDVVDWGAVRERTRRVEAAQRQDGLEGRDPVLASDALSLLERARQLVGVAPSGLARLSFPRAVDAAQAERLRAAAAAVAALDLSIDTGVRRAEEAIAFSARRVATTSPVKERLEAELRALAARAGEARLLVRSASERIAQRAGGFTARLRYWVAQVRGVGAPALLAKLDVSMRRWSGERPVLGAELTYVRGALRPPPLPSAVVAPAYLDGNSDLRLEDISEGSEIDQTAEIAQKAAELRTPAAAYEFVKNEFRLDWYYGSLKGASETFRERRGNDVDLASTLIALLRSQGVPARYVRGTVEMPAGRVAELMGLLTAAELDLLSGGGDVPAQARDRVLAALPAAGIPFEPVIAGGRVRALRFVHTWVEAYVAYGNYRGAGKGAGAKAWVPLDPALPGGPKYAARAPAADALALTGLSAGELTSDYLQTGEPRSPLDLVRSRVSEALAARSGPTYAEVLRTVDQREERLGFIPGSLPYEVVAVHDEYAFLPDEAKHQVRFVVSDSSGAVIEKTLPLHRLVGHRTLIAWEPASEADATMIAQAGGLYEAPASAVQLVPVLRVDGIPQGTGSRSLGLGAPTAWRMQLLLPDGSSRVVANQVIAGNFVAIGLGGPGNGYVEAQDDSGFRDGAAARFLYARAATYANAWTEAEEELARLLQVVPLRPTASVVIVENQLAVDEVLGVRRRVVWKGLQVDADHRTMVPLELVPGREKELLRLSGFQGSYLEAQVLREATGVGAVAAVSVIQEAHRRGVPVLTITPGNSGAELPRLTTGQDVRREVEDQIARGREVTIPAGDLTIESWTGTGFIARDTATEEAGYFLSGVVSGGQTIVSPGAWQDAALVEILESPDAPAATSDTSRIARIIYLSGSGQEVVAGESAPSPLSVCVTTQTGVPVAGAKVTFRSVAASKPRFAASATRDGTFEALEVRTNERGIARAWVDPDPSILAHAIIRKGDPNEEFVGLNEIMAETQGPDTPKIALSRPLLFLVRHDVPSAVRTRCSLADAQNYCAREYRAGLQIGLGIWARVEDRFGNWVPNASLVWTSSQPTGKFVDLAAATDGVMRVLDPSDPAQVNVLSAKTTTIGEVTTDYIPDRFPVESSGIVDLTAKVGHVAGVFRLRVTTPGAGLEEQFAFRLRHEEAADFAGIFGGKFLEPVGGQVFRWTGGTNGAPRLWEPLTGRESDLERVQVQMDVWDVTAPVRKLLSTHLAEPWPTSPLDPWASFDDARTAAFWPAYEVDGGEQRNEFHARVTVAGGRTVDCTDAWVVQSESRRPAVETLRLLPGWIEKATDEFGYASSDDVAVAFRIRNPAGYPIYARLTPRPSKPGDAFVFIPGPDQAARHPDDATLIKLMPHATTSLVLPLDARTEGGTIELELHIPDAQGGVFAVRQLGYVSSRIRVAPPGAAIASGDDLLRATVILPVRNFESTAAPPSGRIAPDTSTEPPILIPADLEFRVKGSGLLSVTSGGALVAQAEVQADPATGDVLSMAPASAGAPMPRVTDTKSLSVRIGPADPTVHDVTLLFKDQTRVLPFETVVKDAGPLPVGHTFVKDVSVVDGHIAKSFTDVSITGRGGGLTFTRSYTSRGFEASPLGSGWTHSYRSFVMKDMSGGKIRYLVVGGEGGGQVFDCSSPALGCTPQRGYHGTLTASDREIIYRARSGTEYRYARLAESISLPRFWLTSIADPRGNATTLEYGDASVGGELLRVYEPGNRRLLQFSYEWPQGGRHPQMTKVALLANPGGALGGDRPFLPIDERGVCVAFGYDGHQNLSSSVRYDGGCPESATQEGRVARSEAYLYAGGTNEAFWDNLVRYTDPNGNVTEYAYYASEDVVAGEGQYLLMGDKQERVKEVREPAPGGVTKFEFSLVPKATAVLGDVQPLYETRVVPARAGSAPTVYRLDAYGAQAQRGVAVRTTQWDRVHVRPIEETDPRGRRVTMSYDERGNLIERDTTTVPLADPSGAPPTEPILDGTGTPIGGISEKWAYHPQYGGETCHLDAEGRLTVTEYALGLPTSRREYARPLAPGLVSSASECSALAGQAESSAEDRVSTFTYCDVNATCTATLARKGDLFETIEGTRRAKVTAYDLHGYASTVEVTVSGARSIATRKEHDARGRLRSESDDLGHELVRVFDGLDRVVSVEKVNRGGNSPGEYRSFGYYAGGQLQLETMGTVADPDALLRRSIHLDGLNLPDVVTETLADGETLTTTTRHDAAGNAFEVVDRRGVRKVTSFDDLDRPRDVTVFVDEPETFERPERGGDLAGYVPGRRIALFEYDSAGNKIAETDQHGHRTELRLDSLYRVARVMAPPVPDANPGSSAKEVYEIRRRYDRVGNKLEETDGNGDTTRFTYDFANRVLRAVDPVGRFEQRKYDGLGQVVEERKGVLGGPGGTEAVHLTRTSKGYDGLGRPLGWVERFADLGGAESVAEIDVAYDDDARAVEERDRRGAVTRRMLDGLDRVYEETLDAVGTKLARTGEAVRLPALRLTTRYEYDLAGNRSAVIDPLGRRSEEVRDGLGRVVSWTLPMGVAEQAAYDGEGNVVWKKDRRGIETRRRYDVLGRETKQLLVEAQSNDRRELALVTRQYEDAADPDGLVKMVELDALGRGTTRVLDALHREVKALDAGSGVVERRHDAVRRRAVRDRKGFVTEYDVDGAGRPTAQREKDLGGMTAYEQAWSYDDAARKETWTDRRRMPTVTERDGLGRARQVRRGSGQDVQTEVTHYDGNGNVVRAVDANEHATESSYDGANRKISETRGAGTAVAGTTTFKYDAAGNRTETKGPRGAWEFDVRESYDDLNRSVRSEVPTGDPTRPYAVTTRAFDGAGNKLCEKRPLGGDPLAGGAAGMNVAQIEVAACAGEQVTRYAYDELSKLVSVLDAGGGEHSFVYDEVRNLLAKQDANGNLTTYRYDRLNRRTDEWQHLDLHARVRSRGAVPDGAAEGPADPAHEAGALHWHAVYDANGNVTERTDPKGVTVVASYGVLNRLETETYPEPMLSPAYPYPLGVTYAYDGNGNVDLVTERKRTAAGATAEEVRDPEYDALGRLESERRYDGKVVSYGYDAKGNRTRVTDPDQVETTYTYDAQDRLETATTPQGTARYRYWPDGLRKEATFPNGLEEARCYDAAGRVTAIVTAKEAIAETCATPGRLVSRFDYGYDANGNRVRQLERRTDPVSQLVGGTEETRYGYDAQDRLVGVAYPDDTAVLYRLDAVGNRTGERRTLASKVAALTVAAFAALAPADAQADVAATFNRADWLVAQVDAKEASRSATYGYDLAGNLTEKVKGALHRDFRWSYRNTLTVVLDGGVEVGRYDYDAELQRVKRTTAQEQVEYVLDEKHVLQEARGAESGHPSYRRYHYADGPLAVVDGAGSRLISTDALGSPTDLTGAAGSVASMRKYDAWGQYRNDTAPAPNEPKLGFTGHQYDPETGLVYARARYYDADLGRFLSRDALDRDALDAPNLHRYVWARGNPLRFFDPSGFAEEEARGVSVPIPVEGSDETPVCLSNTGACPSASQASLPSDPEIAQFERSKEARAAAARRLLNSAGAPVEGGQPESDAQPEFDPQSRLGPEEQETLAVGHARVAPGRAVAKKMEDVKEVAEAGAQTTSAGATFVAVTGKRITGGEASEEEIREAKKTIVINNSPLIAVGAVRGIGKASRLLKAAEVGTSRLVGANRAIIDPRKLTEYALNPNHPVGGHKARVFERLGFNRGNADDLIQQLRIGVMENAPIPGKVDQFGARFTVDIPVIGPQGSGIVRAGWIFKSGSNTPELTTLFVK